MYRNGEGVPQSDRQAVAWYSKAAEQGFAHAQYNLGMMYNNGAGVSQNRDKAREWLRKAAAQGYDASAKGSYKVGPGLEAGRVGQDIVHNHTYRDKPERPSINGPTSSGTTRQPTATATRSADASRAFPPSESPPNIALFRGAA